MIGPLFDRPLAPPGKGVWVNGVLTFPAVPVATLSPSASDPSEDQAGGDPLVSRLRRRCHAGGAEPGVFCVRQPGDPAMVLVHRGRL